MTKSSVDLFDFLFKISKSNIEYLNNLSIEDKKSLSPVVIMKWLSYTSDKEQIKKINSILNPFVFKLYNHSELLFKLIISSVTGKTVRYKWIKKISKDTRPLQLEILQQYYKCSKIEAKKYIDSYTKEDIIQLAVELGEDDLIINKIKKE